MKACAVDDCTAPTVAKGMCRRHYSRHRSRIRNGYPKPRPTPEDRFWSYVTKAGDDECWLWHGATRSDGYGVLTVNGRTVRAHRFSYALHNAEPASAGFVCHACDTPACVNPSHLWLGDAKANMRDMGDKGRSRFHKEQFRGEAHGNSTLTESDVRNLRRLREDGWTYRRLAARFSTSTTNACDIANRKTWRHIE